MRSYFKLDVQSGKSKILFEVLVVRMRSGMGRSNGRLSHMQANCGSNYSFQ